MALLAVFQDTSLGIEALKKNFFKIKEQINVESVSSVYKKYLKNKNDDLNSQVFYVLKTSSDQDLDQFVVLINQLFKNENKTKLILLSFEQIIIMRADMTLPNPMLFQDPGILRCSAEVMGSFQHPILGQKLDKLMEAIPEFDKIEFFCQGGSLL